MRTLLKLEELAQFVACVVILILHDVPWWTYLLLALGPDIGMLGYLASPRVGTFTYNLLHHKGIALLLLLIGFAIIPSLVLMREEAMSHTFTIAAIILYGHASMDRMFGYGLKFGDNFHHTHLGWIGKLKNAEK